MKLEMTVGEARYSRKFRSSLLSYPGLCKFENGITLAVKPSGKSE